MNNQVEKLVIIGSGPAGLTAALYSSRAFLNPLIIDGPNPGGLLMGTSYIENWPGCISILGPDLIKNLRDHALQFSTRFLNESVYEVNLLQRPFLIKTETKTIYAHSIIIATGAKSKHLNCPGESQYWTKGVTTCAVCDGFFYKNKPVVIVGGGDSAMENSVFMTNYTDDITVIHILDKLTASKSMQDKAFKTNKIKFIYNSTVDEIIGNNNLVTAVSIKNQITQNITQIPANGVFISIGLIPSSTLFKGQLELDNYGYIILKDKTETSIKGVFAAGDVCDKIYRQAITSAGAGCSAALDAERYLNSLNI